MNNSISDEVALRIGMAARALPACDVSHMLKILANIVDFPPSIEDLSGLSTKELQAAVAGELLNASPHHLNDALALLKGEGLQETEHLPVPKGLAEGEMPDSIRVAIASDYGENLNGHFGSCRQFLIYQVSAEEIRLVDLRMTAGPASRDEKNAFRARLIRDCQLLYVVSIGGPAAAQVIKRSIHPVKMAGGRDAREILAELQNILAASPPPWLARAMRQPPVNHVIQK